MLATVRDIGEADGTIGFFSFIPRYVVERSIDILSDGSEIFTQREFAMETISSAPLGDRSLPLRHWLLSGVEASNAEAVESKSLSKTLNLKD